MKRKKRVLVAPLNWGLGHATRCVPIVKSLLKAGAEVVIAASGNSLQLMREEFANLELIDTGEKEIRYGGNGLGWFRAMAMVPTLLMAVVNDNRKLKRIVQQREIDVVISDNRFGFWNNKVYSVFVTHQVFIKWGIGQGLANRLNSYLMNKYNEVWIPDEEGDDGLTGDLSHKQKLSNKFYFVGLLSRFEYRVDEKKEYMYKVMVVVSGPEPQREVFENLMIDQLQKMDVIALVVCGKPQEKDRGFLKGKVVVRSMLHTSEMETAFRGSEVIVSRSGYSTLMDLARLGKNAIFIPTPGQTEQEYLAKRMQEKGIAYYQEQGSIDLKAALQESKKYTGFNPQKPSVALQKRIEYLLS